MVQLIHRFTHIVTIIAIKGPLIQAFFWIKIEFIIWLPNEIIMIIYLTWF